MKDDSNVYEAKKIIKAHIKFFESLLTHLNGADAVQKGRAMWTAWCMDNYLNEGLVADITKAIEIHGGASD